MLGCAQHAIDGHLRIDAQQIQNAVSIHVVVDQQRARRVTPIGIVSAIGQVALIQSFQRWECRDV